MTGNEMDAPEQRDYLSYLLRVWRVEVRERTTWRASLECPNTGQQLGFPDLAALCRYLRVETDQEEDDAPRS